MPNVATSSSYLGSWAIDALLTFTVNTHRFDTGVATDADSAPAYRVYEDETGTAILSGTMAKLDDANTTGFYSEQITLSAANGFERGKCYSVYLSATVNSVVGTSAYSFQILAGVDVVAISNDTAAADTFESWLDQAVTGTADSGTTTTMIDASRTEADTDYWKGAGILFTSGNLAGQYRTITAFDPAIDQITFTPAVTQAVATQTYEIIPQASPAFEVMEATLSYQAAMRIMLAALSGKASGFDGSLVAYRDVADSKNRISAQVDSKGNRSIVTLNGS
jgi:hypothetical protein